MYSENICFFLQLQEKERERESQTHRFFIISFWFYSYENIILSQSCTNFGKKREREREKTSSIHWQSEQVFYCILVVLELSVWLVNEKKNEKKRKEKSMYSREKKETKRREIGIVKNSIIRCVCVCFCYSAITFFVVTCRYHPATSTGCSDD